MERKTVSVIALILLLTGTLGLTFFAGLVTAGGTVYIRADGSVDPPTAPISSVDNVTYTFTDDINDTFVIERNNIVVNGAGYTVQGPGNGTILFGRSNVTIKNLEIKAHYFGIYFYNSTNNIIQGNNITNNYYGVMLSSSSNNEFYRNNFIGNTIQAYNELGYVNTWDDGYPSGGNYWSDYNGTDFYSGPYQNETGSDGIGDNPYVIDVNNQDNYPLIEPWTTVTLTVIGPWFGTELDKFLPVLEAFEGSTGINVEYNFMYSSDLVNSLPSMFEAETTPGDVIFVWPWFIQEIGPQGHAVNVTGLIDEADFRPGALDQVRVDGTLYGGAYTGKVKPGFWYRKSFFAANNLTEPSTWEEFVALLDAIAAISGIVNPIVSGDNVGWPLSDVTEHFLITFGGPQLQRDLISGEAKWIGSQVRTIFEDRLVPLLQGNFSDPIEWTTALNLWWNGSFGLYFMGSWITGMVDVPEDLGVFSLPGAAGAVFAPDYFFVPTYTEYPAEAQQLFQFLASAEAQEIQVEQSGHIATNIHVPLDAYPPVDRSVAELMEGMEVVPDLDDAIGGEFQTTFWEQLKLLWMYPGQLDAVLEAIQAVAPPKTWYVPLDFPTIQEAIDAATDRDTILVYNGTYNENVDVYKQLNIYGRYGAEVTIVNAFDPNDDVFYVNASNVNISGFTVTGASNYGLAGIELDNADYCNISNNVVTKNWNGILLFDSSKNTISDNNVSLNTQYYGIVITSSSNYNTVSNNNASNNYHGISIGSSSYSNIAFNNEVNSNTFSGIYLSVSASGNTVSDNYVLNNYRGFFISSSNNNTIYHNNIIDNTVQVDSSDSTNLWDDGYPSGGNYWSDYNGTDFYSGPYQNETGSDGIGDSSYFISVNNQDNYPLMEPWPHARVYVDPLISYAGVGETFSIDVRIADVANLYGFEFKLGYNTTFLDATDIDVQPFLNEPTLVLKEEITDEFGFVWVAVTSQSPAEEVDGSGTLGTIIFHVTGLGEGVLDLYDTNLSDSNGFPISLHSEEDGYYEGGTTQVVSTESTATSANPSLVVDSSGNVHVAWYDYTDYAGSGSDVDIFYKRYEVGVGWTVTEVVSTESTDDSSKPSLAVDQAGNVHIAWEDLTDYNSCGTDRDIFYKRYEVGSSWTSTEVASTESTSTSHGPSLAVDQAGNAHVAWYDYTNYAGSGTDWDIFYKAKVGGNWTTTEVVSTESTNSSAYPSLAVDSSGSVHIAWRDVTDIFYKARIAGNWTTTEVVSTESTEHSTRPSLAVDSSGSVHIAWDDLTDYAGSGNDTDIFYKRYEIGSNWTATEVVSTESTGDSWAPSLVVDSSRNVHVAWYDYTDYAGSGSDVDIFYRYLRVHSTQYPWSMFRHNLRHTGYTESPAPNTNQTQWTYTTSHAVRSSPAVADGMVFVGSYDGNVYALDQHTGAQIWNYTTGNWMFSSPAVVGGMVFVGSNDGNVYAFDQYTGAHVWNYTTGGPVAWSSPAVADVKVYVGSVDGRVYCLNASTGTHIWNYTTGDVVYSSPAVADGMVFVGSYDGNVYALDQHTGAQIWNYTTGSYISSSPAVADGKVYVGSSDMKVYSLDASTGTHIWNYTTGDVLASSPAVADGRVYVGSYDTRIYSLNASTGTHIWNYTIGWPVGTSSPAVADGRVYVGSWDGKVYSLDAATGAHIWNYTTGDRVESSPAVADGMLFVGSNDNVVYAFGNIIRVPEDYPTVQEAIDAATPGATILIAPGIYYEDIVIDKPLTIIGETGSSTTFEGGGSGIAVTITNTYEVTVANIVITNWDQGIFIDNSSDVTIYDNIMFYMGDSGIAVDGDNAVNNLIYSNTIYSNNIAINLTWSSTSNTIYSNTISLNHIGLYLESSGNTVYANTISENTVGINMTNSNRNTIYWNNFINNIQQADSSNLVNTWHNGLPSGGNYWSDYEERYPNATEWGDSGIWNTPYVINVYNVDDYPLMNPIHEITVTMVTPYKTVVGRGYSLKINVTVANQGRYPETFELTLYANIPVVATLTNIFLTSRGSTILTFTWDTTGFAYGNYDISAVADTVQGEIDTADNTLTYSSVVVTIPGDVDGDGDVDFSDFIILAGAYGASSGDLGYDERADFDGDGDVDFSDFIILAGNYGKAI